ncbi:major capsid protein [Nitratireductor sp. GCM10026969]|uniref:major capsid protein n=1 Tax=Nitratireductor sp. GCM10026969 TaxID=3252645 RepID=UPI00360F226D
MPTYFTTAQVVAAAEALDRFTPWLRNTFFGRVVQFETEEILFDKLGRRRKIAPFVSPNVPGKERKQRGREVRAYKPPYVKPKSGLNPSDAQARQVGEAYGGALSMLDRYDMMVMQALADHEEEITGREELMCSSGLQTGTITVKGEGIDDVVDYHRDADLTIALAAGDRWGEVGVAPLDNIREWARLVAAKSGGVVRDFVMGYGATDIFTKDIDVREILDNRRQRGGEMELGGVTSGGVDDVARYVGTIDGSLRFWEYVQTYEDDDGNTQHYWPEFGVGAIAPQMMGTMTYGAIQDVKSLRAEQRFAKQWEEEDPSREVLMTQSAPLPVPVEPNASAFISVR